ncbi:hypothetical protein ACH4UM_09885 [Streptomyces sp. NPDC020801]|uniref:hypothetical protein n=1 Tax=unclassified Streptomyces TaxID=2593676 RepID=UPI0037933DE9
MDGAPPGDGIAAAYERHGRTTAVLAADRTRPLTRVRHELARDSARAQAAALRGTAVRAGGRPVRYECDS